MDCDPPAYAEVSVNFEFVRNHPLTTPPGAKITRSRNVVNYKAQLDREWRSLFEPSVMAVGPIFVHPGDIRCLLVLCTLEHPYCLMIATEVVKRKMHGCYPLVY